MEEQIEQQRNINGTNSSRGIVFSIFFSFVLSRIPIGNFLFAIPLIIGTSRIAKLREVILSFVSVLVLTVVISAWEAFDANTDVFSVGMFVFTIFFPVALGTASAIWCMTRFTDLGKKFRFFICGAVASVMAAAFRLVITQENVVSSNLKETLKSGYEVLFANGFGLSSDAFIEMSIWLFKFVLVPMILVLSGFSIVIAESMVHKFDWAWQDSVGKWSIPNDFVWVFLISFFAAIIATVLHLPEIVNVVLWNLALVTALVYGIQGFAILVFRARKGNPYFMVNRLAGLVAFLALIPGFNLVVIIGLPLLGVLETWIVFRKPNKENSYENHFES